MRQLGRWFCIGSQVQQIPPGRGEGGHEGGHEVGGQEREGRGSENDL